MAYVLEYTSRYYQRKRACRNAALFTLGIAMAVFVVAGCVVFTKYKEPTFNQIMNVGYEAKSGLHVAPYQSNASSLFKLRRAWDSSVSQQKALLPYLRHAWASVPMTNLVAGVSDCLVSRSSGLEILEPESFAIRSSDSPEDWTGTDSSWVNGYVVTIVWRTRENHIYEDTAPVVVGALSNLFAEATSQTAVANSAIVRKIVFPTGNHAGQKVVSEYAFPTIRRIPVSRNLAAVTDGLHAFHKEIADLILNSKATADAKKSLQEAFSTGKPNKEDAKVKREAEFADAMDPGDYLRKDPYVQSDDAVKKLLDLWEKKTHGRYPWQRRVARNLFKSKNFYDPIQLQSFVQGLPGPDVINKSHEAFLGKCDGLTNAIANVSFGEYDLDPYDPAPIHATTNLLLEACGAPVLPTNRILRVSGGESLTLLHPAKKTRDGFMLAVPGNASRTNRYAFSEWTYTYASTNATVGLSEAAAGLTGFVGCGLGYEPSDVEVSLQKGRISSICVKGLLPLRLSLEEK